MGSPNKQTSFQVYNFKPEIYKVIKSMGFDEPTTCQQKFIPLWQKNETNILCQAWTGSGKTHAFLLPVINNVDVNDNRTQVVIIVPTKELGFQIKQNLKAFCDALPKLRVRSTLTTNEVVKLEENSDEHPHVLIGTPNRLLQLLEDGRVFFTLASSLMIDECDMLFHKDFMNTLDAILLKMNNNVQISIFSATINSSIRDWIIKYVPNIEFLNVNKNSISNSNIKHILINTQHRDRLQCLDQLLKFINPYFCIIFVNNKTMINKVYKLVSQRNEKVALLHGNLPTRTRLRLIKDIRDLKYQYLIASDLASRGLDIDGASHVISLELPNNTEFYIHRSGRSGRKNYEGVSYVFYETEDEFQINNLIRQNIKFEYWKLTDQDFKIKKTHKAAQNRIDANHYKTREIMAKYGSKHIKPGYKAKRKRQIQKIERKKNSWKR